MIEVLSLDGQRLAAGHDVPSKRVWGKHVRRKHLARMVCYFLAGAMKTRLVVQGRQHVAVELPVDRVPGDDRSGVEAGVLEAVDEPIAGH